MNIQGVRLKLVYLVVIILLGLGAVIINDRHQTGHKASPSSAAGVDCTAQAATNVITVFYKPGATANQLHQLVQSTDGMLSERYQSLSAISITVPSQTTASALQHLKTNPLVTNVQVSAAEGCIDPD